MGDGVWDESADSKLGFSHNWVPGSGFRVPGSGTRDPGLMISRLGLQVSVARLGITNRLQGGVLATP